MTIVNGSGAVIPVSNLNAYFQQALHTTARSQRLDTDDPTLAYLTHLLTDYARSERLYDHTQDGMVRRPLVDIYKQASEAETNAERELALQRLGDLALFVSGFLPHSLQRGLVDVDYYVAMGAAAYGNLSDSASAGNRVRALTLGLRAALATLHRLRRPDRRDHRARQSGPQSRSDAPARALGQDWEPSSRPPTGGMRGDPGACRRGALRPRKGQRGWQLEEHRPTLDLHARQVGHVSGPPRITGCNVETFCERHSP